MFRGKKEYLRQIFCGGYHTIFLTKDRNILVLGCNTNGQLGLGDLINRDKPIPLKFFDDKTVFTVACGYNHTIFLADGKVYACGWNAAGQCCVNERTTNIKNVVEIKFCSVVVMIASGYGHNLMLTSRNEVFCNGDNDYGQLGINRKEKKFFKMNQILFFAKNKINVIKIWCGNCVSFFLSENGKLYGAGRSSQKQLGGDKRSYYVPRQIVNLCKRNSLGRFGINSYFSGSLHFCYINRQNDVLTWGYNNYGECGGNSNFNEIFPPIDVFQGKKKIDFCSFGYYHSFFYTLDREIISCGNNSSGQLGLSKDGRSVKIPMVVEVDGLNNEKIRTIACGWWHTLLQTVSGRIFVSGKNSSSQLGGYVDGLKFFREINYIVEPFDENFVGVKYIEDYSDVFIFFA